MGIALPVSRLLLAAALVVSTTSAAFAADRDETVRFSPRTSSARYLDSLKGYDVVNYYLDARAGQTMEVYFEKSKSTCYFNVLAPSGGKTVYDGTLGDDRYKGVLEESGKYRVVVYLMRVDARRGATCKYEIGFGID
jgi:hypothetical protein